MTARRIPVLIAGGGPVGLALAGELGWRGVACLLVEQTDGSIVTPKMNEVNVRTMEFCRRWGIADHVHNCPFPRDHARDVVFVTSFTGYELGRIPRPAVAGLRPEPKSSKDWSPMRLQICSQMWFDPILRNFALSHPGVELRHRTRLESFEDLGNSVTAEIVDLETGKHETIEADYLVGCDGATSAIRGKLGIELTGQGTLGHPVHLFFRAPDFLKRVGKAEGTFFLAIDRGGLWANIRVVDPVNAMWRLMMLDSDGRQTPESIDKAALIRRAVGQPFEVEWLGCSIWTRRSLVAREYAKGRVFLAGDAVHQLSPTGAMGMNTGIGDVVDLGWKLAAVAQGWGGPKLLASYSASGNRSACAPSTTPQAFISRMANSTTALPRSKTTPTRAVRCAPRSARSWCARSAACSAPSASSSAIAMRTRRSLCRTAPSRRRTIRRISSPRRGPARARRTWR
jgi:2-polyprenyl-6-methoxyphenol hydroxylase-like FAD-dependent oxidoreductase